jgi:DNA repair exonuclease SbcCD nuclease subunit
VFDNLAAGYPRAIDGLYNIGVLHSCVGGSEGHAPYAPCSLDDLRAKQYDYWALGHVHKRQTLAKDPHVVFPGNIQGRDIGETGPKGCVIVEVDSAHNTQVEFCPLDVVRWEHLAVDLATAETEDDVIALVRQSLGESWRQGDGLPMAVRVTLGGPTPAHERLAVDWQRIVQEVRNQAIQAADGQLWVEKVVQRTKPFCPPDEAALDGPLGELLSLVRDLQADEAALAELAAEFPELRSGGQLAEYLGGDDAWLHEELPAVESLLVGHLTGAEARR